MKASRTVVVLGIIVFIAIGVRIYDLTGTGFWRDEGASVMFAEKPTLEHWMTDNHPPLYYALLALWSRFSTTDFSLRLLSVILGVITVPVVYSIGRSLFGISAGLWAAAILALLPVHVQYSREVRMYPLMTLLVAGVLWGIVQIIKKRSILSWSLYVTCSVLLCYSHGIGLLYWFILALLLAVWLFADGQRSKPVWLSFFIANTVVGLAFLPWAGVLLARTQQVVDSFWIQKPEILSIVRIPLIEFTLSNIPPLHQVLANFGIDPAFAPRNRMLALPIIGLLLLGLSYHVRRLRLAVLGIFAAVVLPMVFLFVLSITLKPLLIVRAVLPVTVPLALVLGAAQEIRRWRQLSSALLALLLVVLSLGTASFHHSPEWEPWRREGWREASSYLQASVKSGDVVFVRPGRGLYLLKRYDHSGKLVPEQLVEAKPYLTRDQVLIQDRFYKLAATVHSGHTLWVVDYAAGIKVPINVMIAGPFKKIDVKEFMGVSVTEFNSPIDDKHARLDSAYSDRSANA